MRLMEALPLMPEVDALEERIRLLERLRSSGGRERELLAKLDTLNAELAFTRRVGDELYERWKSAQASIIDVMRELSQRIRERAKKDETR
jgi:hypothetical protein